MGCQCTKHNDTAILCYDDVYDGEKNCFGQKHGYGEFLYSNGDVYRGCWKYNKMHGAGVYIPLSGERRDGFFRNGVFIGKHWDQPKVFIEEKPVQSQLPPQTDKQLEAERAQRKLEREQRRMKFEKDRTERRKRREEFLQKYPKRTHSKKYGTIQR